MIQNPDIGYVFGGNRFQLSTTDRRFEFSDNFTYVAGRHTLRTGVDINVNHDRDYFVYGPAGDFHFASLADVATGAFEFDLQSFGQSTALFTVPTYSLFAQDHYQATSKLYLNYGVRWDYQQLAQPTVCNPADLFFVRAGSLSGDFEVVSQLWSALGLPAAGTTNSLQSGVYAHLQHSTGSQ